MTVDLSPPVPIRDDEANLPDALDSRQTALVDAIAGGQSLADAAKAAGVCYRTARRWKRQPEIAGAIRERIQEQIGLGRAVMASGMARAARSLVDMSDGTTPAEAPRVSAARAVVEGAVKLAEIDELVARLEQLEARLAEQPSRLRR